MPTAEDIQTLQSRRLDHLRMQAALKGATTPPETQIEIEDLEQRLGLTPNEPTMTAPSSIAKLNESSFLAGQHDAKIDALNVSVVNLTQTVERLVIDIVPAMKDIAQTARTAADAAQKSAERAMLLAFIAIIAVAVLAILVL